MLSQQWFTWLVIAGLKLLVISGVLSAALQHGDDASLASTSQSVHDSLSQTGFQAAGYSRNCGRGPVYFSEAEASGTPGIDARQWGSSPTDGDFTADAMGIDFDADSDLTRWVPLSDYERLWTEFPPIASDGLVQSDLKPKLAVLMFVSLTPAQPISNSRMWASWVNNAKAEGLDFSMLFHGDKTARFNDQTPEDEINLKLLDQYYVNKTVPTARCDVFNAQMFLLREALRDPDITHVVTVSVNSVPLKPLSFMYEQIKQEPATRMCMDYNWTNPGTRKTFPRAETWWLMSRSDASLFVDNEDLVLDIFNETKLSCADEERWALPLLLRKSRWKDKVGLLDECVMFTDWINSCKEWENHANGCNPCKNLRKEPHAESTLQRPRKYDHVGVKAWHELTQTRFWFGRKFADDAFLDIKSPWLVKNTTAIGQPPRRPRKSSRKLAVT